MKKYSGWKPGLNCKGKPSNINRADEEVSTPRGARRLARQAAGQTKPPHSHTWVHWNLKGVDAYWDARVNNEALFYCKQVNTSKRKRGGGQRIGCGASCRPGSPGLK